MQIEDRLFDEFINKYSPYKYHKTYLKNLLTGSKANSLCRFKGYNTTEDLAAAMMDSVSASVRGKDTVIGVYKDLVQFLAEKGMNIEIEFPPVSVDSSLDRLLFIAKHFQDKDATIEELPNILWVSERTIETDLARLKGDAEDILSVCGRKFYIPETKREDGRLNYASTLHPLFLTENLTQVIIMLEGLKHMAENLDEYKRLNSAIDNKIELKKLETEIKKEKYSAWLNWLILTLSFFSAIGAIPLISRTSGYSEMCLLNIACILFVVLAGIILYKLYWKRR